MDLNHLYSQHQIALIKAGGAANAADREKYLECATRIARRIGGYQQSHGAGASASWQTDQFRFLRPTAFTRLEGTAL